MLIAIITKHLLKYFRIKAGSNTAWRADIEYSQCYKINLITEDIMQKQQTQEEINRLPFTQLRQTNLDMTATSHHAKVFHYFNVFISFCQIQVFNVQRRIQNVRGDSCICTIFTQKVNTSGEKRGMFKK